MTVFAHPSGSRLLLVTLAAPLLVLVGCAGPSGAPAGVASAGPSAGPSAARSTEVAAAETGPLTGRSLCALVPVADANAATGVQPAFDQQAPGTFAHGEPECGYSSRDRAVIVNVTVFSAADTKVDPGHPVASSGDMTEVDGLGDRATINENEIDVAAGDDVLVVETFSTTALSRDQLIAMAKRFLSKL